MYSVMLCMGVCMMLINWYLMFDEVVYIVDDCEVKVFVVDVVFVEVVVVLMVVLSYLCLVLVVGGEFEGVMFYDEVFSGEEGVDIGDFQIGFGMLYMLGIMG